MPSTCLASQVAVPLWAGKPCVQVLSASFPEYELNGLLPEQQLSPRLCIYEAGSHARKISNWFTIRTLPIMLI